MEFGGPADWGLALAILLMVLTSLISNKGLVTSTQLAEWKEHYNNERERSQKERDRADAADLALRENTKQLERVIDILDLTNQLRQGKDSDAPR